MWDKRYGTEDYAYGKEPNAFFSTHLDGVDPGLLLLPGEGEGRNAVYSALNGWTVDAFDQSSVGKSKALALASELGVEINYLACLLEDFQFITNRYDAAGLLFFHSDPAGRIQGILLEMLFDEETLSSDFALFNTFLLEKQEIKLNEGPFHQGMASVIRFLGIKPN